MLYVLMNGEHYCICRFNCVPDGKNPYSSRRRLRPEMISGPQGDFKHTGHVGLDGAYFGDVAFLGDKVQPGTFVQKKLSKVVAH